LVVVTVAWLLSRSGLKVPEVVKDLLPRLKSVSVAGVEFELAEVKELWIAEQGVVDLRNAGRPAQVNDSTLRSFYEQIRDKTRLTYAVIDLGAGREWLTSRLFVLSVILSRMRGLEVLVFVETAGSIRRRFIGSCQAAVVRWRLAKRFPWFEAAITHAEVVPGQGVWTRPEPLAHQDFMVAVVNDEGRLEDFNQTAEPSAKLLREFLSLIQTPSPPPQPPPASPNEWVELPSDTTIAEHAQWITGRDAEEMFSGALDPSTLRLSALQGRPDAEKARLVLDQPGRWIALTLDDSVFYRIIDRSSVVEMLARKALPT
jgi:hypothetical protein